MRGCLVLDIRMPGMSGLDLQEKLAQEGAHMPVIIVTGHGDVPITVRATRFRPRSKNTARYGTRKTGANAPAAAWRP